MQSINPKDSLWLDIRRMAVLNTLIALTILLFQSAFGAAVNHPWRWLLANMIYAHVIGFTAGLTGPRVAVRVAVMTPLRRWTIYPLALILAGAVGSAIASTIMLLAGFVPPQYFWTHFRGSTLISVTATLVVGIAAYVNGQLQSRVEETTLQLRTQQLERERIQKLAAEAHLSSLQSRLQPHFLFNTINSILALIREDPASAETMLQRLSRLLRYALDTQTHPTVPLADELRLVQDYLEIEQVRFGGRLRFTLDIMPGLDKVEIPPYALQTLIENSMKYAIAPRREGGVILLRVSGGAGGLTVEVSDDGPGFQAAQMSEGHGLDILQKRLASLYGGRGSLEISESRGGAHVRLRIPLEAPA